MKFFTKNNIVQKMIASISILVAVTFAVPQYSYCEADFSIGGTLFKEVLQLLGSVGDVIMGLFNNVMLGADGFGSAMLDANDPNLTDSRSWIYVDPNEEVDKQCDNIDTNSIFGGIKYQIPNMLYAPENIFANNIAALDVNFLRSNTFSPISTSSDAEKKAESGAGKLRETISSWYKTFRNIAVVGLLSVLIYLGIRILISSTAQDKAKYKETLQNWFVALCLVFIIHFIMSGILMITDKCTELFSTSVNDGIVVSTPSTTGTGDIKFRTNLMGLVRFQAQSTEWQQVGAYTVIYFALIIYTCVFTFMYFKRFLYTAFFTMIAPLVALTYPIDKAGDGKAQAFNIWFKEYTMNVIIQPVHLILYTVFVSSAIDLAMDNPVYALVAIAFLIPAEKFIKKMFGLDKADSTSGVGAFAGGAMAMKGFQQLASLAKGGSNKKGGNSKSDEEGASDKLHTVDRSRLGSFGGDGQEGENGGSETVRQEGTREGSGGEQREGEQEPGGPRSREELADVNYASMTPEEQQMMFGGGPSGGDSSTGTNTGAPGENNQINNANLEPQKGWKRKLLGKGAKKLGKVAYKGAKLAAMAGGAMGGMAIGAAAGIASGDFSKTMQYAGAGALAGGSMEKGLGRLTDKAYGSVSGGKLGDKVFNSAQGLQKTINKAKYGDAYANEQARNAQNERVKEKLLNNKDEVAKFGSMATNIKDSTGKNYSNEELMKASFDYNEAGITDMKQIERGLTLEAKHGGINGNNHDKMIDIMDMAQTYNADYMLDEKKRTGLEQYVESKVSKDKDRQQVMQFLSEANGTDEHYAKHGKYGTNRSTQTTRPNNTNSGN